MSAAASTVTHPDTNPTGKNSQRMLEASQPYLLNVYAKPPVVFQRGQGSYLFDMDDRKYLDFTAGIAVCALGHADPHVAEVAAEQAAQLVHISNLYHNPHALALSKKLIDSANQHKPHAFKSVFFTNSGTEANECALKIARKYAKDVHSENTDKINIIAFEHAFHGRSMGALSTTANLKYRKPYFPLIPGVHHHPYNQLEGLEELINAKACAVILEPIQGEGGVVAATSDFLTRVRDLCNQHDVLLIYDEIQCGLGRTGKLWAHQHYPDHLMPDIMTVAKPLANGFPIGACLVSERAGGCMHVGDHGTTFGGSPFATRIGLHVLDRISHPSFLKHVNDTGTVLKQTLEKLANDFPVLIKQIRGHGLLIGVEMQNADLVGALVKTSRERGLLLVGAGRNSVRVVPPLIIGEAEIKQAVDILESSLISMSSA